MKAQKNLLIKYNKPTTTMIVNLSYRIFYIDWNYTTILSYLFILNAKMALMAMICCNQSNTIWKIKSTIIGTFFATKEESNEILFSLFIQLASNHGAGDFYP